MATLFSKLMPREGRFFDFFNAHALRIVEGSQELVGLMANLGDAENYTRRIDDAERAADKITHDTLLVLHSTFITPIDRDQIHQLITSMDDILDLIQDFAEAMYLYDIRQLTPEARQLSDIVASSCERVRSAVVLLNKMDNAPGMLKLCREIDQLESDADRAMRTGITKLFREEADVRQLIKMKGIYELLESVTDRCEDVANIIEGIILENS